MSLLNLVRDDLLKTQDNSSSADLAKYRLHANELPWSPVTQDSLNLNCYPNQKSLNELHELMAKMYQVESNQMALTRGSDDGIDFITRLFLNPREDALMQFPPTFSMYAFYVQLQQAQLIDCALQLPKFSLSLDAIKQAWQSNCKVIMFCSPNNPTGNLIDLELIAATCKYYSKRSIVVVDEAYVEFANKQSASSLIPQHGNLVVLRTLSKARGLAGIRLGCILAQASIIKAFNNIIPPYLIPSPVIELAQKALKKSGWVSAMSERIKTGRQWLIEELAKLSFIDTIYRSESNFILLKTSYSNELSTWLASKGIAIRIFKSNPLLHQHVRITVGDEFQNQLLINAMSEFKNQ